MDVFIPSIIFVLFKIFVMSRGLIEIQSDSLALSDYFIFHMLKCYWMIGCFLSNNTF